jgi:hypothetical protein
VFLVTRDHAPQAVLRIHESLVRIRIRGSIPLTNKQKNYKFFVVVVDVLKVTAKMAESGSGSADPYLSLMDPDPAIFVSDLQDIN